MAGRPTLSLAERVAQKSFVARRHRDLLDGDLIAGPPELRELQVRFQQAGSGREKRKIARDFAAAVEAAAVEAASKGSDVRTSAGDRQPQNARRVRDLPRKPRPSPSIRLPLLSPAGKNLPESDQGEQPEPNEWAAAIAKVWATPAPWRDTSVSAEEAHRHTNREPQHFPAPGSLSEPSRPPVGPPSEPMTSD